jgi:hypothetical protein
MRIQFVRDPFLFLLHAGYQPLNDAARRKADDIARTGALRRGLFQCSICGGFQGQHLRNCKILLTTARGAE